MKKKILALCLVIALAVTAVTGVTLAYFTDTDAADNVFTIGNVDIELTEPKWDENLDGAEKIEDVYPGQEIEKDPTVTNTGSNPCYVRVTVDGLKPFAEGVAPIELVGIDSTKWVKGSESTDSKHVYYYTEVLEPEAVVTLFTSIVIPTGVTNADSADYTIPVSAEAIQSEGFETYTEAWAQY